MIYLNNAIFFIFVVQLLIITFIDIKTAKIYNVWPIFNIIFFIIIQFLDQKIIFLSIDKILFVVCFLAVGLILYLLKIMGGGDSKYLSSLFLITPNLWHEDLLIKLVSATIIVGSFSMLTNITRNKQQLINSILIQDYKSTFLALGGKFPFSTVILISWCWLGVEKLRFL